MTKSIFLFGIALLIGTGAAACSQEISAETDQKPITSAVIANNNSVFEVAERNNDLPVTTVELDKMVIELGDIIQGQKVSEIVMLTNTGAEPLIISSAKGSCGCTVPQYPTAPIPPGESAEVEVIFSSKGKSGMQNKTVTIVANTDPNPIRIAVKGNVIVPKEAINVK